MILAIDIGNTNVVLGGIEGNDILFEARMATDSIKTSDQYCAELKNILALFDVVPSMIDGTIVASVDAAGAQFVPHRHPQADGEELPCCRPRHPHGPEHPHGQSHGDRQRPHRRLRRGHP